MAPRDTPRIPVTLAKLLALVILVAGILAAAVIVTMVLIAVVT